MDIIENLITRSSLRPEVAQKLSHSTKSIPMMEEITPRWLLNFLPWVGVEAGVYRVNKIKKYSTVASQIVGADKNEPQVPQPKQLLNIPPFKYIDPALVENATSHFATEQYEIGSIISKIKHEGDKLFIVAKGQVEVTTQGEYGEKLSVTILSEGDCSNIEAFIQKSDRPIVMKALTACELFSLERTCFENCINNSPQLLASFNSALQRWTEEKKNLNVHGEKLIKQRSGNIGDYDLPETFPEYEENPREYTLSLVQTILRINSNVSDLFNTPINQLDEQLRLTVEAMKERQEWELINNKNFGLINSAAPSMRVQTKKGAPTPDDMDELLAQVWKKPAFFVAHPKAIAAFGRECTQRGVPPTTVNLYGSPFLTWRGVPIIPCDKLLIDGTTCNQSRCGTTNILLMRVGEQEQGVIGLHQPGIPDEKYMPSLSVKFAGIDNKGISSYIMNLYFSAAVLTDDALGVLENVEVGNYYE